MLKQQQIDFFDESSSESSLSAKSPDVVFISGKKTLK